MKKLLWLVLIIVFIGCNPEDEDPVVSTERNGTYELINCYKFQKEGTIKFNDTTVTFGGTYFYPIWTTYVKGGYTFKYEIENNLLTYWDYVDSIWVTDFYTDFNNGGYFYLYELDSFDCPKYDFYYQFKKVTDY